MMNTNLLGDLTNKTVLTISSERGDVTRELAAKMAGGGGRLIVTDISDERFPGLRKDLESFDLYVEFIRTSALNMAGIRPGSIDLVVCNFALCAINAVIGQGELALHKFYQVLKPAGMLYIEEELPFYMAASPAQTIWAQQSRLLKAAQMLTGNRSSNEYQPDVLEALVTVTGFVEADVADELMDIPTSEWWEPFQIRFERVVDAIESQALKEALQSNLQKLKENAFSIGRMEIPYVILTAKKPWRIE